MAKNHKSPAKKKSAPKLASKARAKKARPAPVRSAAAKAAPNGKPKLNGKPKPNGKSPPNRKPTPGVKPALSGKPVLSGKPTSNGKPASRGKPVKNSPPMEKPSKKTALRDSILKRKAPTKPIAFSLDEVRAIAKTVTSKTAVPFPKPGSKPASAKNSALGLEKVKPQHVKAASLADILGFNPKKGRPAEPMSDKDVPEKFKRFYKLLLDLRAHLTEGIERHSEETLKRSAKDDAGDLSAYGQHMADAGTDTFDRDFALSMVASEQEALSEIDAAIKRIHNGTYGVCEITQKPIAKERLLAVPFTRYSAEAQKDLERNRHRSRTQAGLFGEMGEEGGKIMDDEGGGDE
jgi:RNA polymerase-binding transcription factor DksA